MIFLPYICLFFVLFLFSIPVCSSSNSGTLSSCKSIQYILPLFLLIIFFGFRGFIDTDISNYYPIYNDLPNLFFDKVETIKKCLKHYPFEIGYFYFTCFLKSCGLNYFGYQFINTTIDFIVLYSFFSRYCKNRIIMAFCLYYLFGCFSFEVNLLRNTKAIMLFIISIRYLQERKPLKYFILNGLGLLFHASAFIFLPLYFFIYKKPNKKIFIVLYILGNVIYLLKIKWIKSFLVFLFPFFPDIKIFNLIGTYFINSDFGEFGITIGYLERTITSILIFLYFERLSSDKQKYVFLNCFYIYIFIYLYFSEAYILIQRLPLLFVFSYWILLPRIYDFLKKENKALFLVFIFLYGILKVYSLTNKQILIYDNYLFGLKFDFNQRLENIRKYSGR